MSSRIEIQEAIEQLPQGELLAIADWIDKKVHAERHGSLPQAWLNSARGAAKPGVSTAEIMSLTRGE